MAASGSGKIIFYGENADEAEDFVFAVKERAYAAGKQKDNAWIAEFASICFAKKALRWYEELDEETQNDWKLLRRAILAKYTADAQSASTILPTAAPASPRPPTSLPPHLAPAAPPPTPSNSIKGYIRVEASRQAPGYIGKDLIHNEWCTTVATRSEAIVVEFLATTGTLRFEGEGDTLAVQIHYKALNCAPGSRGFGALFKGLKPRTSAVYQWSGPRLDNLWSIVDGDKLVAHWPTDEDGKWALQPVIYSVDRRLYMTVDATAFAKGAEEEFYKPAILRWEKL